MTMLNWLPVSVTDGGCPGAATVTVPTEKVGVMPATPAGPVAPVGAIPERQVGRYASGIPNAVGNPSAKRTDSRTRLSS